MSVRMMAQGRKPAAGGGDSIDAVILSHSPLVYWRFGESSGTSAADESGNSYTGTIGGSVTLGATGLVSGDADTCFDFPGGGGSSATRVQNTSFGTELNGLSAVTVLCLVNADAISDKGIWIANGVDVGSDDVLGLRFDVGGFAGGGSNVFKGGIDTTGGTTSFETATGTAVTGSTLRLAFRWQSGSAPNLWIDGSAASMSAAPASRTGTIRNASGIWVGAGSKNDNMDGRIDEFAVIGSYLSDTDLTEWDTAAQGS